LVGELVSLDSLGVFVPAPVAYRLAPTLEAARRRALEGGGRIPPDVARTLDAIAAAAAWYAASVPGSVTLPPDPEPPPLPHDPISTTEAACLLGTGARNVRDLPPAASCPAASVAASGGSTAPTFSSVVGTRRR